MESSADDVVYSHVLGFDNRRQKFGQTNDLFNQASSVATSLVSRVNPFKTAACLDSLSHAITRATPETLKHVFDSFATIDRDGKKYMTPENFIRDYLGLYTEENYNHETVRLLASAADTSKDGLISYDEFQAFDNSLCAPDALYLVAFELFNNNATEFITADNFEKIIRHTTPLQKLDFDFNSEFIKKYFGAKKDRHVGYRAFCQLLHDFYEEQGHQAFNKFDTKKDGAITAEDFHYIMTSVKGHLLTDYVKENLISLAASDSSSHAVRFPFFQAFNSMLGKIELFKRIYTELSRGNFSHPLTKEDVLHATQAYGQITPYEVDLLFNLAEIAHPGNKVITLQDIERIDPVRLKRVAYIHRLADLKAVTTKEDRGVGTAILESAYRFALGSIAGATGATAVYPIDLVKTRMQNQRTTSLVGEVMYKNSFDCFKKVLKFEGFRGLYRGLPPQIVGVAPEKAIKLTVNDLVRDKLTFDGDIALISEIVAGGCAGGSQVVFTNPLEIVKIRLQVAGEIQTPGHHVNVFTVIKDLGLKGLYKGATACLLRDVPFSAIYFPTYAHMKKITTDEQGLNSPGSLFVSAFTAGVPAAALVTPADVIKTRLQVAARAGQTTYSGLFDCTRKIMAEEGPIAFWKGTGARVFRSSPQFAVTLLTYELLQRLFYVDFGGIRPSGSEAAIASQLTDNISERTEHVGGYRLAAATFTGIEHKFGLFFPKFETVAK